MNFESSEPRVEKVTLAAIKIGDEVFIGAHHVDAIEKVEAVYPDWTERAEEITEGFITTTGRFVDRAVAGKIAKSGGQLENLGPAESRDAEQSLDSDTINE